MKEILKKLFHLTKNYPLVATILFAAGHFIFGHFMFGDKVTNIYDLFDEWYYTILIIYAIFLGFIVSLSYKLNKALDKLNELGVKDSHTQDSDESSV